MRTIRVGLVAVLLALGGCAAGSASSDAGGGRPGSGGPSGSSAVGVVTVFAAASLTESFTTIGRQFEAQYPSISVTFNFAGSSALATQIDEGAPADVFASASAKTMPAEIQGTPTTFVRNQLVIAVAEGNPERIAGPADLGRPGLKVALCAEAVPCGAAAATALAAGGVQITPVTLEQDVKAALSKVKLGEVDAALVYRTDARAAAADVDGVEFPESATAVNDYPIVALKNAKNPAAARAFIDYVLSADGVQVLTEAGFQAP